MSVHKYNVSADSNVTVGDGVDAVSIAEGMARSAVNDAMRTMAADAAKLYQDLGGVAVTTGNGLAYSVALASDYTSYFVGMFFRARLNIDCSAGATINVNGLGPRPLMVRGANTIIAPLAGDLKANEVVSLVYNGSAFYVVGGASQAEVTTSIQAATDLANQADAAASAAATAASAAQATADAALPAGATAANSDQIGGLAPNQFVRTDAGSTITGLVHVSRPTEEQMRFGYDTGASRDAFVAFYQGATIRRGFIAAGTFGLAVFSDEGAQLRLNGQNDATLNGSSVLTSVAGFKGDYAIGSLILARKISGGGANYGQDISGANLRGASVEGGVGGGALVGRWLARCHLTAVDQKGVFERWQ